MPEVPKIDRQTGKPSPTIFDEVVALVLYVLTPPLVFVLGIYLVGVGIAAIVDYYWRSFSTSIWVTRGILVLIFVGAMWGVVKWAPRVSEYVDLVARIVRWLRTHIVKWFIIGALIGFLLQVGLVSVAQGYDTEAQVLASLLGLLAIALHFLWLIGVRIRAELARRRLSRRVNPQTILLDQQRQRQVEIERLHASLSEASQLITKIEASVLEHARREKELKDQLATLTRLQDLGRPQREAIERVFADYIKQEKHRALIFNFTTTFFFTLAATALVYIRNELVRTAVWPWSGA